MFAVTANGKLLLSYILHKAEKCWVYEWRLVQLELNRTDAILAR